MNSFIAGILSAILAASLVIEYHFISFGEPHTFCHEGVQYLETYHGISVQVDKFGRVVTCH